MSVFQLGAIIVISIFSVQLYTDLSKNIATENGARVIDVLEKGYGETLLNGIKNSEGKYIIFADSDDSYDFSDLQPFISKLEEGFDFVVGNRFKGEIKDVPGLEDNGVELYNEYSTQIDDFNLSATEIAALSKAKRTYD